MDAPELTNFGSLVRHALMIESAASAFYEGPGSALGPLATELAAAHRERHRVVARARQQYLNEVILEPISGLDGRKYVVDVAPADPTDARSRALALEETSAAFYADSAEVAGALLAEAARTFRKLGEGNARNVDKLRGAVGN